MLTVNQILSDNRKMERFICDRLRTERTRIVLAGGRPPDGPAWVDLTLYLCDDGDHELVIESNEPDAFRLRDVYEHFRRQEITVTEMMKQERTSPITLSRPGGITTKKTDDDLRPNKSGTLTVKEAAAELNCSISFVYKLMYLGELVYEKRGRRKLPTDASIAEYRLRNIVRASQRFDYPKKDAHEPYQYQQLFKKVKRKKRGT